MRPAFGASWLRAADVSPPLWLLRFECAAAGTARKRKWAAADGAGAEAAAGGGGPPLFVEVERVFAAPTLAPLDALVAALDRTASREEVAGFKTASTEVISRQLAPWLFPPLARAFLAADARLRALPAGHSAFLTAVQYNRYDGEAGDHFDVFHTDEVESATSYKELSLVVFLSEPNDFGGGAFQVRATEDAPPLSLRAPQNSAVCFRARRLLHRVTPVTAGCRRSLVAWATVRDVSRQYEPCWSFDSVLAQE